MQSKRKHHKQEARLKARYRRLVVGVLAMGVSAGGVSLVQAQSGLAAKELARRQANAAEAKELLMQGREAYARRDFQAAHNNYRRALDLLPYGPRNAALRKEVLAHLADGSVALAQDYRRKGKYDEAKQMLDEVIAEDPKYFEAEKSREYFDDPIRTNPSLTYKHTQNIDKVRRLLYEGEGFYNLGQYDEAEDKFRDVLRIDPYNKAARRWLERCAAIKSDYYRAAYDETRARLLMEVDKAWELTVPPEEDTEVFPISAETIQTDGAGAQLIYQKLKNIILPSVNFEEVTVQEAIEYLRQRSIELDNLSTGVGDRGVNFFLAETPSSASVPTGADTDLGDADIGLGGTDPGATTVTVRLTNVPLEQALGYVCEAAGLTYRVEDYAVKLVPVDNAGAVNLQTREWSVPPNFVSQLQPGGGSSEASDDPFAEDDGGLGGGGLSPTLGVQEALEQSGIDFPEGASAQYIPGSSRLIVRNTLTNLDQVDQLVMASQEQRPKQVKISTKFVEVSQENTDELGFDWIVSPFDVSSQFLVGGGVLGNGVARTLADAVNIGQVVQIPSGVGNSDPIPSGMVTGGLRTGDGAISANNIDAVLNNPNRISQNEVVAPGILSFTGLFDEGSFQMIIRGLAQKKGVDVMTAPSVTAKSGKEASIEIVREFIYPTEYEPPELPNNVGGGIGLGGGAGIFPVTPATPTAFETRNTGVTLQIRPVIGPDNYTIDLEFAPEIVEFEGFINYGSPITSPAEDALGNPTSVTITDNRIEMPVFASRRVKTNLTIFDGHTVAVGGLMREDVQNVEDKVPILGDLPWIGRLFQSKAENHVKSNLIIFVTPQIIDATGKPFLDQGEPADSINEFDMAPAVDSGPSFLPYSDK